MTTWSPEELSALSAALGALATVVLVIITAWYARLTKRLAESAKESAAEAVRSAGAAERSAVASARTADFQEALLEPSFEVTAMFMPTGEATAMLMPSDSALSAPPIGSRTPEEGFLFGVYLRNNGPTVVIQEIDILDLFFADGGMSTPREAGFGLVMREPKRLNRGERTLFILRDRDRAMFRTASFERLDVQMRYQFLGASDSRQANLVAMNSEQT